MSMTLRVLLLVAALYTAGWILYKIRKLKVKMEDAIFWMIFAGILCILGIFPHITYWLTDRIGILSPANLIFLVVIFLLIEKVFTLSIIVSQLEEKVTVLSSEVALRSHSADKRLTENEKELSAHLSQEMNSEIQSMGNVQKTVKEKKNGKQKGSKI